VDAAPVDSVRRWADCMVQARQESLERSLVAVSPSQPVWGDKASANRDGVTQAVDGFGNAVGQSGEVQSGMHWQTQSLSPFAVKPVAYESTSSANKPRSSADRMARAGSLNALASEALETGLPTLPPMSQRTNWEYHPVVMAARRITSVGVEDGPEDEEGTSSTRSHTRRSNALPRVVSRPRLDCELDDVCWSDLRWQRTDDLMFACVTDMEYLYVAVVDSGNFGNSRADSTRPQSLELWVDGDGDLLSSFRFWCDSQGNRQSTVDGSVRWQPNWYAALSGWGEEQSSDASASGVTLGRGPQVLAEIAIPLVEILPRTDALSRLSEQFAVRVRSSSASDSAAATAGQPRGVDAGRLASDFQALPDPQHWRFFPMPRE
ncbi:MAG: exo-alpha-sialidase, partial [Rhodopirellula sp. JB055]